MVAARRVLTTMWVDITSVSIRVTRGVVYLTGYLERMTVSHNDFNDSTLRELDTRLRAIPQTRDVKYQLQNWQRNLRGEWLPGSHRVVREPTTTGVFEITDEPTPPDVGD